MVHKVIFLCLSVTLSLISAKSIQDGASDEAMQNPDLFEGDILGFEPGDDRNAVVEKHRVWPNGRIPYTIDPKLKPQEPQIKEAMQHYADKTCIRFVPRTDETQYVRIFPGKGCYSHVGKTLGDQPLSLGAGCFKFGIIVHELGHAVGFFHEHSRSDRDDYLNIHYENIQTGMESQFVKLRPKQNRLLTPFDFDSVMLYGETVFSKSHYDGLKTMTAKDGRTLQEVTEKPGLSTSDIERITMLYKCMESQFVKLRPKQNRLLTPFDFDSVMLYGETVFSKSHYDGLKTMTAKDGRTLQEVTEKPGLSTSDIERITMLYKC